MELENVDLLFLCDPPNVKYLVGVGPYITRTMFEASFSECVIVDRERELPTLLTNAFYRPFYQENLNGLLECVGLVTELRKHIRNRKKVRKVVTSTYTPEYLLTQLKASLPKAKIEVDSSPLDRIRSIKNELEIVALREAADIAVSMMSHAREACVSGRKECEVAGEAEREMRMMGADTFTFSTIVSSGAVLGLPQEIASEKIIRDGELVMIDLGATKNCYNAEFTRTIPVGTIPTELKRIYRIVHEALEACIAVAEPGITAGEVDKEARDIVNAAGYDYAHATGHGIGTAVWEYPRIDHGSRVKLRENMFVALEPAIYIKGVGGVRLEQNLLITRNGPDIFTKFSFEDQLLQ